MHFDALLQQDFEQVDVVRDAAAGVTGFIAIHSTALGPAFGGIRRWPYRSPEEALADALRLAEAMTWKCALAGVPGGGGKCALIQRDGMDRAAAYRAVGRTVARLGGCYYTGPDVGTEAADLERVAELTDHVALAGPGGPGNLAEPTARGVLAALCAVAERLGRGLDGLRVAVQGLGEVGWRLAELLAAAGARLVVADVRGAMVERAADELGASATTHEAVLAADVDVFAPCALGGVVDGRAVEELRARAVCGAANNVLADPACGEALFRRGVLYAPDFVANAGALIHGALFHLEGAAPPAERIAAIGARVGELLDEARAAGRPPERIAEDQARAIVAAARR